jgi:hypothetical protein
MSKSNTRTLTVAVSASLFPTEEKAKAEAERMALELVYLSECATAERIERGNISWLVQVVLDLKDPR